MGEDLFEKGLALLKKIQRGALPEDSQALYDKGMAMIQGEDPDFQTQEEAIQAAQDAEMADMEAKAEAESGMTEDEKQDALAKAREAEGEALEVDNAEATVDSVMDEQLEEATEEALKDKPE